MSAIGEKHGWLLADKHYLGGLLTCKAWGYWTGYTAAQIELMVADAPLVVYNDGKKREPRRSEIDRAKQIWGDLDEKEVKNVKLSDILSN